MKVVSHPCACALSIQMSRLAVRVKSGLGPVCCLCAGHPNFLPTLFPSLVQHLNLNCRRRRRHWTMGTKRKAPSAKEETRKKSRAITSFFSGAGEESRKKPRAATPVLSGAGDPVIDFDKDAWAETLTEDQKRLLQLELETMHVSWLAELKDVLITPQFLSLKEFLEREKEEKRIVYPAEADIYSW